MVLARVAVLLTLLAGAVVFTPRPVAKEPEPAVSSTLEHLYGRIGVREGSSATDRLKHSAGSYYDSAKEGVEDSAGSFGQAADQAQGFASRGYEKLKHGAKAGMEAASDATQGTVDAAKEGYEHGKHRDFGDELDPADREALRRANEGQHYLETIYGGRMEVAEQAGHKLQEQAREEAKTTAGKGYDILKDAAGRVKGAGEDALDTAERAKEGGEHYLNRAGDAAGGILNKGKRLGREGEEKAHGIYESAKGGVHDVIETVGDAYHRAVLAAESAAHQAHRAYQEAEHKLAQARHLAAEGAKKAKHGAEIGAEDAKIGYERSVHAAHTAAVKAKATYERARENLESARKKAGEVYEVAGDKGAAYYDYLKGVAVQTQHGLSYAKNVAAEKLVEAKDYVFDTKDHVTGDVKKNDVGSWWTWALWGSQAQKKYEAKKYGTGWRLWWSAKDTAADLVEHAPEYYAQARDTSAEYYQQARATAGDVSDYVMDTKDYVTGDVKKRDEGKWWKWALWGQKAQAEEAAKRYGLGWRLWWSAKDTAADLVEHAPEYYAQARDTSTEYYQQARETAGDVSDYLMDTKDYVTGDVKKRDEGSWWKWAVWGQKAREEEEAKRYGGWQYWWAAKDRIAQAAERTPEYVNIAAERAPEYASKTWNAASEAGGQIADTAAKAKKTAAEWADSARENVVEPAAYKAGDLAGSTAEVLGTAAESARAAAREGSKAYDAAKRTGEHVYNRAGEIVEDARAPAEDYAAAAKAKGEEAYDTVRGTGQEAYEKAEDYAGAAKRRGKEAGGMATGVLGEAERKAQEFVQTVKSKAGQLVHGARGKAGEAKETGEEYLGAAKEKGERLAREAGDSVRSAERTGEEYVGGAKRKGDELTRKAGDRLKGTVHKATEQYPDEARRKLEELTREVEARLEEVFRAGEEYSGSAGEQVAEQPHQWWQFWKHKAGNGYDDISRRASDTYDDVSRRASDTYDDVSGRARETYDDVSGRARDSYDDVSSSAQDTYDDISGRARSEFGGRAKGVGRRAADGIGGLGRAAQEGVRRAGEGVKNVAQGVNDGRKKGIENLEARMRTAREVLMDQVHEIEHPQQLFDRLNTYSAFVNRQAHEATHRAISSSMAVAHKAQSAAVTATRLAHLLAFSIAVGTGFWVTFVAGVVMFNALPRRQFGFIQSKLFPAYFQIMGLCSSIALITFAAIHPFWGSTPEERRQLLVLGTTLGATLVNLLYLEPKTTQVMDARTKVEQKAEVEVEDEEPVTMTVKTSPDIAALNKRFGVLHGLSSISNLVALGGLSVHLWYLASRLVL